MVQGIPESASVGLSNGQSCGKFIEILNFSLPDKVVFGFEKDKFHERKHKSGFW